MDLRLRELNTKYLNLSPSHRPVIYEFNFFPFPLRHGIQTCNSGQQSAGNRDQVPV